MNKDAESKKVPKLRFKEFSDEWVEKPISKALKIGSGKDYKHLNIGDVPVYGTGGYMLSVDKYLYDGESVCIGRKGTIDKPIFLNGKFWTVDTLFYTHSFNNSIPKFIYSIFQKINWKLYNEASGVPSLSKSTIEKIKINLPTLPEQQKIADCLSTWDEVIETQKSLIEAKKLYKKGMMQKIFSQELRFKADDGSDFPEWVEKKLGEVSECLDNLRKPLNDSERQKMQGNIPYWGANNIMDYINDYIFDETIVLLAEDGGNFSEYRTRPIANLSKGKCWVNNHTHVLREKRIFLKMNFYFIHWFIKI